MMLMTDIEWRALSKVYIINKYSLTMRKVSIVSIELAYIYYVDTCKEGYLQWRIPVSNCEVKETLEEAKEYVISEMGKRIEKQKEHINLMSMYVENVKKMEEVHFCYDIKG
jgi:hypothetical protein